MLILKSHDADSDDIINFFVSEFQKLNKKFSITVNKQTQFVCAFMMTFTENMFQQAINNDFLSHKALFECHSCFCNKKNRNNLFYNIVEHDYYHYNILKT